MNGVSESRPGGDDVHELRDRFRSARHVVIKVSGQVFKKFKDGRHFLDRADADRFLDRLFYHIFFPVEFDQTLTLNQVI